MQSKQKLLETLLSKSHECNTLAQENQQVAQKNSTFRLQLQRTLVSRSPVSWTPESRFQADNLSMIRHIKDLHEEQGNLRKEIEIRQEIHHKPKKGIDRFEDEDPSCPSLPRFDVDNLKVFLRTAQCDAGFDLDSSRIGNDMVEECQTGN